MSLNYILMSTVEAVVPGQGDMPIVGGNYMLHPANLFKLFFEWGMKFLSFRITLAPNVSFTLWQFAIASIVISIVAYLLHGLMTRGD